MPAEEGSPIVTQYNYATGEYMRPSFYGEEVSRTKPLSGLDTEINNRNTRMNRKGYAPTPNYMKGTGNSPMERGGNNLMPSQIQGFKYVTSGGYPPPSAMPQNANTYPRFFNHKTGQREDPQQFDAGLVPYRPRHIDKHSSDTHIPALKSFYPSYLSGASLPFRDVSGSGGYKFRQFSDNSIQILLSPKGGAGTIVPKGSESWVAIINEIGQYPSSSSLLQTGKQIAQSDKAQQGFQTLFDTWVSGKQTEQARMKVEQEGLKRQAQPTKTPLQKATPYLIGVGMIVGLGTVLAVLTK